ncbi:MAG: hypothetical protein JOZ77_10085 [Candidatus Eremiobacteraeota bacterium]|nr:hypothetical protein [Candidatus Eremiobacteraeota bacterium]
MIRTGLMTIGAASVLAACGGHGVVPASQTGSAPMTPVTFGDEKSHSTTCAKSPPQYWWIFAGSCDAFKLSPTGGSFSLAKYDDLTVTGSIGKNTVKGSATIDLADAVDKNGDIGKYKGQAFPPYKANGTTIVYATANNQTTQTIKPITVKGKPVLQYVITNTKGFPGKTCAAAVLGQGRTGKLEWTAFPGQAQVKGDKVTITVYEAPSGFELPPKGTPIYFAINCFS